MAVVLESWSVYLCLIFSPEFLQKSQTTKIDGPKEEEKGIKRTSIDKTKRNKSKVSEKISADGMDSGSLNNLDSTNNNNYTPSTRSTRFPDQGPSEESTKKEVKITLRDYILHRKKTNTQEWVNSNDQKSWTTNLRQPNSILRL